MSTCMILCKGARLALYAGRTIHIPVSSSGESPMTSNQRTMAHGKFSPLYLNEKKAWTLATSSPRIPSVLDPMLTKMQSLRGASFHHKGCTDMFDSHAS